MSILKKWDSICSNDVPYRKICLINDNMNYDKLYDLDVKPKKLIKLNREDVKEFIRGAGSYIKSGRYEKNRGGRRPMTVYECRKCAERFDVPDKRKVNEKIKERIISTCPLCKSNRATVSNFF